MQPAQFRKPAPDSLLTLLPTFGRRLCPWLQQRRRALRGAGIFGFCCGTWCRTRNLPTARARRWDAHFDEVRPLIRGAGKFLLGLLLLAPLGSRAGAESRGTILFFGDSLTAGYGLDDPMGSAFPALIQQQLDEAGHAYRVINAGLSGETSAGGLRRIDWVLRQPVDIFMLALGANDGLRGLPLASIRENLGRIFEKVRAKNPDAKLVLAGMRLPTSMGGYANDFAALFPEVADEYDAALIPFLLEGVGGVPELNLPDRIHPTAEGHAAVAETVWRHIKPLMESD